MTDFVILDAGSVHWIERGNILGGSIVKTTSRFFSSVASIVAVGSIACGQSCTPTLVTTFDTPGTAWDVFVVGSTAYVADAASGLQIFDVSNPASPVAIGSYAAAVGAGRVVVQDEIAFVCRGSAGVDLVDVTDPTAASFAVDLSVAVWKFDCECESRWDHDVCRRLADALSCC